MPKFQMLSGNHVTVSGKERQLVEGQGGKKKKFIITDENLDFKFGTARFRRTDGKISTGRYDAESPPKSPEAGTAEEVEVHEIVMSGDRAAASPPKKAKKSLLEEEDIIDGADDDGDEDKSENEEEELAGPRDSKDVTKKFKKLAMKALVKVFHDAKKDEYIVTDEDDVTKPLDVKGAGHLKDADAVKTFLKNYTKGN